MKKKVLAISGSTREFSSNLRFIKAIIKLAERDLDIEVFNSIAGLPHFNPDLDEGAPPETVSILRNKIKESDGVLICTPEYVFSLPGSLKNAIEWTISTTIFTDKPVALITASGLGQKAHESLLLIMKTICAKCNETSQLLIQGARTKVNDNNEITDRQTLESIRDVINSFISAMKENTHLN